jgi:hypothetical protein
MKKRGKQSQKPKKPYIRLFNIEENCQKAVMLINAGYTPGAIGKILDCDRTSIIAFQERQEKQGMKFIKPKGHKKQLKRKKEEEPVRKTYIDRSIKYDEKINTGKSYAEYLEDYKRQCEREKLERVCGKENLAKLN